MQPQTKSDGFTPKWRQFHPQATVWVINPFDHDVVFSVADEHNNQYQYRMPAGKTSELPGGAVATLGVKAIVDELIQKDDKDIYSMWEVGVRAKHEAKIILRVKEAAMSVSAKIGGEVNLATTDEKDDEATETVQEVEKPVFPTKKDKPDFSVGALNGKKDVVIDEK